MRSIKNISEVLELDSWRVVSNNTHREVQEFSSWKESIPQGRTDVTKQNEASGSLFVLAPTQGLVNSKVPSRAMRENLSWSIKNFTPPFATYSTYIAASTETSLEVWQYTVFRSSTDQAGRAVRTLRGLTSSVVLEYGGSSLPPGKKIPAVHQWWVTRKCATLSRWKDKEEYCTILKTTHLARQWEGPVRGNHCLPGGLYRKSGCRGTAP
ncbi:hypothetical protein B0H13DRAFT_1850371 [Mycena leptocephala]|nr:hypothetical protein B0H13DRAFT_1850371 [Mycena leptocephala]